MFVLVWPQFFLVMVVYFFYFGLEFLFEYGKKRMTDYIAIPFCFVYYISRFICYCCCGLVDDHFLA